MYEVSSATILRARTFNFVSNVLSISPDGSKVAFTRSIRGNADVWVMDLDGTHLTRLTRNRAFDGFPSWSPDGRTIAFQSGRAGSTDIWTIAPTGVGLRQITSGRSSDRHPVWAPNGSTLAFDSDRAGSFDLWTVSIAAARQPWASGTLPDTHSAD